MKTMVSENEIKVLIRAGALWARFSERISKLPKHLQDTFLTDLETTIDNRLKVLERMKE
jgi:endonuclease III